ncbi:hypothetical protein AMS68_006913 [Peltaster fructicola]|uniref:CUE domain-containing protein n=1 Tax=Peltaster fructicola TaxID=286661 RepID=A0A6H0Y369_9PEZI|nr:hypothetical protein AMS68_006913 [Peltaster fructicola]
MASEQPVSPIKAVEESATTREEMDFDDPTSPQHTGGRVSPVMKEDAPPPPISKSPSPRPRVSFQEHADEIPPPTQPPRRVSSQTAQAEHTLIEAFPSIDVKVIKAVLVASGGQVEPAFNALLSMSDPDFTAEEQRPQQPPRPQRKPLSQMEADELYARQLAEEYSGQPQGNMYNQREPGRRGPNSQRPQYGDDRERSFLDDDLPELGRNIQQGFLETQKKVNSWITNFKKRLDGEDEEEEDDLYSGSSSTAARPARQDPRPFGDRKSQDAQRRSVDQSRYDADPHVLGDDEFSRLELRDDEAPPQLPRRPQGPIDEVEHAELKAGDSAKARKWQPLTSVAPHPEDDNDPFSVGDDDEKDDKPEEVRKEDSERLKDAARQSISENTPAGDQLKESETTGSKNAEAEKILTKTS